MITYLYWAIVIGLVIATLWFVGGRLNNWRAAMITVGVILVVGWAAYYFHFQQIFVRHWGGVMRIEVPAGHHHVHATWKDDNLWIQNYDPSNNTCTFYEYARGNLLEGRVIIRNCNPLLQGLPAESRVASPAPQ